MLFINELRYCLRQPLVWISLILVPLVGYMFSSGSEEGSYSIANQLQLIQITLLMLLLPIVLGAISPAVFLRDTTSNMDELINVTPVSHSKRWLIRYGAVVVLFLLLFTLVFFSVIVAYSFEFGFTAEFFQLTMLNLILLVLPALLIAVAFALWLSTLWQSAMVLYVCIAAAGIGYLVLASMTGSPVLAGSSVISKPFYNAMLWLDPYGISALLDNLQSTNVYTDDKFLLNRLTYLLLSAAFVYSVINPKAASDSTQKRAVNTDCSNLSQQALKKRKQAKSSQRKVRLQISDSVVIQLIKVPLLMLLHSRITQVILLIWPMLIFNEVLSGINQVEVLSVISPNSIDALNLVAFDMFPVLGTFIVALWSWFICSRDKSNNIAELIAAAPISNHQLVLTQIVALSFMILLLIMLTFIGSSMAEIAAGSEWMFGHYIVQLCLSGMPLLVLGTLFVCLHHLCRSSAVSGVVMALIIFIKFTPVMTSLGLTHTLWNVADSPLQAPDNFWGYSASISVYLPYMSVWLLACTSMVLLVIACSHRGTGLGRVSLKGLPKYVSFFFLMTAMAGLILHWSLVIEKPLTNSDKREAWSAAYELNYKDWDNKAQPSVVHIDSEVDIYPQQQFANFKLHYTLENRSLVPISQILVGRYGNYEYGNIALDEAKLIEFDSALNQGVYQLSQPLMPGEQQVMRAEFRFNQSQLWPYRSHQVVKPEFSYLRANPLLPTIGYQNEYQLKNNQTRAKYQLNKITQIEEISLLSASEVANKPMELADIKTDSERSYQWVTLSSTVSTHKDHHAISQGELVNHWQRGQRSFYKFETSNPIHAIPVWISVPYSALSRQQGGVRLNVYAAGESDAKKVNLNAMADTLEWFSNNISPYSGTQLNLIAKPDIGDDGYALPQIILVNDTKGFRAFPAPNAGFDQRYRRAVDETAQQWFAFGLAKGIDSRVDEGESFLIDSLTKYIELVVIEKSYGKEAVRALVDLERKRFELSQHHSSRLPVALINASEKYDIHSRATLVFANLREVIGDKPIIAALKTLWSEHRHSKPPAIAMDFVRALKRHSETRHHRLINELFLNTTTRFSD